MKKAPAGRLAAMILVLACLAVLLLSSCAPSPPPPPEAAPPAPAEAMARVPEAQWPLMADDLDLGGLFEAAQQSLTYLRRLPPDQSFQFGPEAYSAAQMAHSIARFLDIAGRHRNSGELTAALKREFVLYGSLGRDGRGEVLMTGYYEPILDGARSPNRRFSQPIYATPRDLVTIDLKLFGDDLPKRRLVGQVSEQKVRPYPDREAIEHQGAIQGKAKVLAWIEDPVESFFLQIQGSGQVRFPDGSRTRLGYAASNGRPYRGIGKLLLDEGLMSKDEMSMQGIKRLLEVRPELRRRVLAYNPSYVFFRELSPEGGPLGCYETPLTAGRAIATDRKVFPGLAVGFITGERPAPGGKTVPLSRFVLNHDTGGAIRGPGRLDLYFGSGAEAGALAGRMKHNGRLYFLMLKK